MEEYVSPIDGHLHYGHAGRAECAVCCLEAERDRLRTVVNLVEEFRDQHGKFWLLENNEDEAVAAAERESYAWSRVVSALDALSAKVPDG
jgi:hypothetical protein